MQRPDDEVKQLIQHWPEFSKRLRSQGKYQAGGGLNGVSNIEVAHNQVVLWFSNPISLQMTDQPDALDALSAIFSEYLGRPIQIACKYKAGKYIHTPPLR